MKSPVKSAEASDTSTRPLDNPSASTADRQPWPAKPLFLSLKSDLTLTLGNDPVARDALGSVFDAATGGNKDTTIFLRADPMMPYSEVLRIMSLLRAAGYVKISLVEPPALPAQGQATPVERLRHPSKVR